jgi:hypothetical protein
MERKRSALRSVRLNFDKLSCRAHAEVSASLSHLPNQTPPGKSDRAYPPAKAIAFSTCLNPRPSQKTEILNLDIHLLRESHQFHLLWDNKK